MSNPLRNTASTRKPRASYLFALVLAMLLGSPALAQATVITGTLSGTVGDETFTWNTLGTEVEGEFQNTASWVSIGTFYSLSLQGHVGESFSVEDTLDITMTLYSVPENCPCTVTEADITYWTSSSMFDDVYIAEAAEVTLESFELVDDETFAVSGSLSVTLLFQESMTADLDESQTLELSGSFDIERVSQDKLAQEQLE